MAVDKKIQPGAACPIEHALALLGKKYTLLILRDLQTGKKRFGELLKSVHGISTKTLTERLEELEHAKLITRKSYPVIPPKVEYALTKKAKAIDPILESFRAWGKKHSH